MAVVESPGRAGSRFDHPAEKPYNTSASPEEVASKSSVVAANPRPSTAQTPGPPVVPKGLLASIVLPLRRAPVQATPARAPPVSRSTLWLLPGLPIGIGTGPGQGELQCLGHGRLPSYPALRHVGQQQPAGQPGAGKPVVAGDAVIARSGGHRWLGLTTSYFRLHDSQRRGGAVSVLDCGLDKRPLDALIAEQESLLLHENGRGSGHYH